MPHFQLGFRRENALLEAHHRQSILKLADLRRNIDPAFELDDPSRKIGAGGDRQWNTPGKTRIDLDQTDFTAVPFALDVGGPDDIQLFRNTSGECHDFRMLSRDALVADSG